MILFKTPNKLLSTEKRNNIIRNISNTELEFLRVQKLTPKYGLETCAILSNSLFKVKKWFKNQLLNDRKFLSLREDYFTWQFYSLSLLGQNRKL